MARKTSSTERLAGRLARQAVQAEGPTSLVASLQRSEQSVSTSEWVTLTVPLSEVAPHPDNVRRELRDLEGLANSLRQLGQLQSALVDRAETLLAERPDLADAIGDAKYVLRAGHRRLAAAQQAGLESLRVDVAPTVDQIKTYATFVHENLLRASLSPIEEASAFAKLIDLGMTQAEVSALMGVSQPQVSYRIKLLTLTQEQQDALHVGDLPVRAARDLLSLPEKERTAVWSAAAGDLSGLPAAMDEAKDKLRIRKAVEANVATIQQSGDELVTAPPEGWRQLLDEAEVSAARENGTVAAVPQSWGIQYFVPDPVAVQEVAESERFERDRAVARAQRLEAVRQMVQASPATGELLRDLMRVAFNGFDHDRALSLAHKWLKDTMRGGKVAGVPLEDRHAWERAVIESDNDQRQWLAWALAIAQDELRAADPKQRSWGPATRAYIEVLKQSVAYQPTQWEISMMTGGKA